MQNLEEYMEKNVKKTDPDEGGGGKTWLDRVREGLGFRGIPDTTEELEHEIQELLEEGEEHGLISRQEEQMISSIFDFRETMASEIMTPSVEMVCAPADSTVGALVGLITDEGYTRIPIYQDSPDHIIGVLHAKDILRILANDPEPSTALPKYLNSPFFIEESKPITELLHDFQRRKNHMAFVVDEFGSVRGLITLEDVIEEIVGEIDDEHDQDEPELQVIDTCTIVVDAKIDIEEVDSYFDITLPKGPYESIGGLIIYLLGRVPKKGEEVKEDSLSLKVLTADQRRIKTVRIERVDDERVE